ncbi:uncharacterized protein DS421_19g656810 [Arachis hypogaea]|uniref:Uncharacterized protein n=1 Tax=Arachis hypogaea TaxID=3818 RepID=A0A6B9VCG8_ARAHY|nr:uncharacterized protein DS421_19g656810 [Arachis hypogaea]
MKGEGEGGRSCTRRRSCVQPAATGRRKLAWRHRRCRPAPDPPLPPPQPFLFSSSSTLLSSPLSTDPWPNHHQRLPQLPLAAAVLTTAASHRRCNIHLSLDFFLLCSSLQMIIKIHLHLMRMTLHLLSGIYHQSSKESRMLKNMSSYVDGEEGSSLITDCLLTAIKVLINLTNDKTLLAVIKLLNMEDWRLCLC